MQFWVKFAHKFCSLFLGRNMHQLVDDDLFVQGTWDSHLFSIEEFLRGQG